MPIISANNYEFGIWNLLDDLGQGLDQDVKTFSFVDAAYEQNNVLSFREMTATSKLLNCVVIRNNAPRDPLVDCGGFGDPLTPVELLFKLGYTHDLAGKSPTMTGYYISA